MVSIGKPANDFVGCLFPREIEKELLDVLDFERSCWSAYCLMRYSTDLLLYVVLPAVRTVRRLENVGKADGSHPSWPRPVVRPRHHRLTVTPRHAVLTRA
jgi:hypothetical protein